MEEIRSALFLKWTSSSNDTLAHPTSRSFDGAKVILALAELPAPTQRDKNLARSAVWFGRQISLLRREVEGLLPHLNRSSATLLGIGHANCAFKAVWDKERRRDKKRFERPVLELEAEHRTRLPGDLHGSFSDLSASIVETLHAWLSSTGHANSKTPSSEINLEPIAKRANHVFSSQAGFRIFWHEALWQDWRLIETERAIHHAPGDTVLATLQRAWVWHQQSEFIETAMRQSRIEPQSVASKTVVRIEHLTGQKRRLVVRRPPLANLQWKAREHHYRADEAILDGSYLGIFLDAVLPKLGLSCRTILRVWRVLRDVAWLLADDLPSSRRVHGRTLERAGFVLSRESLILALTDSCDLRKDQANAAVTFLTWDASDRNIFRRGLWATPIIALGRRVAICLVPLVAGSPTRQVERWLEKGGLGDQLAGSRRGDRYESWVRRTLLDAMAGNGRLVDASCTRETVNPEDRHIGNIDLLVRVGEWVLVCEVKCLLAPMDPIEHFNYLRKLADAAAQAQRKKVWADENRGKICDTLSIGMDRLKTLRFIPVVVVNQIFGSGYNIGECRIIDLNFLRDFLGSGTFVRRGIFKLADGRMVTHRETIYQNSREAEAKLAEILVDPPHIREVAKRISWLQGRWPTADDEPFFFSVPTYAKMV